MPQGAMAGGERVLLHLLAEVSPEEVVVCAPVASPLGEEVRALGHEMVDFGAPKLDRRAPVRFAAATATAATTLRRAVGEHRFDLLHAFVASATKVVAPVAALTRTPAMLSVHEITTPAAIGVTRSQVQRRLSAVYRRITAVSAYVAGALVESGYRADRVVVVHNGIARRRPPVEAAEARRRLGLPPGLRVGIVGRLTPWKGQHVALEAFAAYCAGGGRGDVVLVGGPFEAGDERYARELRAMAATAPLEGRVHFAGHQTDTELWYDALDAVVVPSIEPDPFPTVVLETGLAGRPVVVSALGGGPEAVVDGVTGIVCDPSPDALGDAFWRLADDAWRRRAGEAARRHVAERFSRARFVSELRGQWAQVRRDAQQSPRARR
jgi:glycosyltransferase involved in cell wall biosynthesis